jgi:hypothetical protein
LTKETTMARNLSRKSRNALRRERRANPPLRDILARLASETPERRAVREKAEALLRLHADSVTWGACVQAVKTGRTAAFKANRALSHAEPAD